MSKYFYYCHSCLALSTSPKCRVCNVELNTKYMPQEPHSYEDKQMIAAMRRYYGNLGVIREYRLVSDSKKKGK